MKFKPSHIINGIIIFILLAAVGATAYLSLQNQDTRSGAANPEGKITLSPLEVSGTGFDLVVTADPDLADDGSALAVDVILKFDTTKLKATGIEAGPLEGTYPYIDNNNAIDNNLGRVYVSWLAYADGQVLDPMTSPNPIGTVQFEVLQEDGTQITIDFTSQKTDDSNIVMASDGNVSDILGAVDQVDVNGGAEQCTPSCDNKSCGDDGCGGVCGVCDTGQTCNEDTLQCEAEPAPDPT
ncbi:hypothetical protein H6764_03200, partial [Candidatus Nomurabacteria bacterium]|nr:hypothetical protein [Candidatus Nomurabacteria bacterium]